MILLSGCLATDVFSCAEIRCCVIWNQVYCHGDVTSTESGVTQLVVDGNTCMCTVWESTKYSNAGYSSMGGALSYSETRSRFHARQS